MSRYRFELASAADDADLRRILAETPMPGRIAVGFGRAPSYFAAAEVDGRFCQVVAARDTRDGRLVGFGVRSIRELYVNGRPAPAGYLSSLRLLSAHRNRGLVARGYGFFRQLHADGRARLYLTTIAEGNEPALRLLTSGRAGLPAYHFAGRYHTVALPLTAQARRQNPQPACAIRPATAEDVPAVLNFLERMGPRRQFFPCYRAEDFFSGGGALKNLRPADLLLAVRAGRILGTLAGWDQRGFRQTVVHGYAAPLRWARWPYNAWARCTGRPILPAAGTSLCYLTGALAVVEGDDLDVFASLLEALLALKSGGDWQVLLIGMHEGDPLLRVLRDLPGTWYSTRLYLVCWPDGEPERAQLDGRATYLELGSL